MTKKTHENVFLVFTLFISTLPHVTRLSPVIIFWTMCFWIYYGLQDNYNLFRFPRIVIFVLSATGIALIVFVSLGKSFGIICVNVLIMLSSMKLFEIKNHRDKMITLFISYFIILSNLLYVVTMLMAFYLIFSVAVSTAYLVFINQADKNIRRSIKTSFILLIQALPLMIILFFIFPRLERNLWGAGDTSVSSTGFSDTLSPGSVSELVMDYKKAFRVEFKGSIPSRQHLYFRGIVFQKFENNSWFRVPPRRLRHGSLKGTEKIDYSIILEPHNSKWLFAIEMPENNAIVFRNRSDHTILSRRDIKTPYHYTLSSYMKYNADISKPPDTISYLLPEDNNKRARELAMEWKKSGLNHEEIIDKALDYFRTGTFYYSLKPPGISDDFIDRFLFETKRGFCEHYASSFTYLMRAAGVPARVVGGYLGGKANPMGGYLIVRQSDAHAWSEVWIKNRGWIRVDPTSVIAPERISGDMETALPTSEIPGFLSSPVTPVDILLENTILAWDALNFNWDMWIMGYSQKNQINILEWLGLNLRTDKGFYILVLSVLILVICGVLIIILPFMKHRKPEPDRALLAYRKFRQKLKQAGVPDYPSMGPVTYSAFAISRTSGISKTIKEITHLYIRIRYSPENGDLKALHKLIHHLKI